MNSIIPDNHRFAFLKPLLWINLLSAGSVVLLFAMGTIGISPAQANSRQQQVALGWEQDRIDELNAAASAPETLSQTPPEKSLASANTSVVKAIEESVPVNHTAAKPAELAIANIAPPEFDLKLETTKRDPANSQDTRPAAIATSSVDTEAETPEGEDMATIDNSQPTTFAQLPSLPPVPVPPNPIPLGSGSSKSSVVQLPTFPQTPSAIPGFPTTIPVGTNNYNPGWGQYPNSYPQTPSALPGFPTNTAVGNNNYNPGWGQYPNSYPQTPSPLPGFPTNTAVGWQQYQNSYPQTPSVLPMAPTMVPVGINNYNPGWGQSPSLPQTIILVPTSAIAGQAGFNPYNPAGGQYPTFPQAIILVPVAVTGMPTGFNPYNPAGGQYPIFSPPPQSWQSPPTQSPVSFNNYYPGGGQASYYPQTQVPLPLPLNSNPVSFNNYYPGGGQASYYPQTQVPLPPPLNTNPVSFNNYYPGGGQGIPLASPLNTNPVSFNNYYPGGGQGIPLASPLNPNPVSFNNYYPGGGQASYYPQTQVTLPPGMNPNPVSFNSYSSIGGQYPVLPPNSPILPGSVNSYPVPANSNNLIVGQAPTIPQLPPVVPNTPIPSPNLGPVPPNQGSSLLRRSTALRTPSLQAQGSYITQGDSSVGRARLAGLYPLTPNVLFGATLDLTSEDSGLADSPGQGLNINELYFATAPFESLPNLRFAIGQLDLTSYFDRNSFAKDGVTHFFNPAFQTNPALSATGIASKVGVVANWTIADNLEAKVAAFSSSGNIGDFALDGFAGEIAFRYGNAIVRGTYATDRDAGADTGFEEIFTISRGDNGEVGLKPGDREEAYGLNAEYFIPKWNMGLFARYGHYINREIDEDASTYSFGVSFLDVLRKNDRLGLAYGQNLSNNQGEEKPDVLELFYDFRFLPNLRLGFSLQQRNGFTETNVGVRVKTEFDVIPTGN